MCTGGGFIDKKGRIKYEENFNYYVDSYELSPMDQQNGIRELRHGFKN